MEKLEDKNVKKLINKKINGNELNRNNFAFFYYNLNTNKYYFYNKEKWFVAASTTKVQIAMLYYEKINNKEINPNMGFVYKAEDFEAGNGLITNNCKVGDSIAIKTLLKEMIINSDNTATNILADGLGGKKIYRKEFAKYTSVELPEKFYKENIISAEYGLDVLKYLFNNLGKYQELIEDMKKSSEYMYLKKYVTDIDIAHKYGSYNGYVHDYGIVYGKNTYLIGIFTKEISNASELIATISRDILEIV